MKYENFIKEIEEKNPHLKKVKENGLTLEFIEEQTEEMCIMAVKENGLVLQYVKNQTEEICLEAVKQNQEALQYVNKKIFD